MSATPVDRLRARDADLPALFSYGFRPFFLGGGLTAAFAVPLWLVMMAPPPHLIDSWMVAGCRGTIAGAPPLRTI